MKVTCYFDDCGNTWDYNGSSKHYVTCTQCGRRISIKKAVRIVGEKEDSK